MEIYREIHRRRPSEKLGGIYRGFVWGGDFPTRRSALVGCTQKRSKRSEYAQTAHVLLERPGLMGPFQPHASILARDPTNASL